ncbi:MAG: hypothetical protein ACTHNN_19625 [Xanthobacteraceae bacterium]
MTYLSDADHAATVEALFLARNLLNVEPSPFTGEITRDEITYDLCIRCDVWPESSRD